MPIIRGMPTKEALVIASGPMDVATRVAMMKTPIITESGVRGSKAVLTVSENSRINKTVVAKKKRKYPSEAITPSIGLPVFRLLLQCSFLVTSKRLISRENQGCSGKAYGRNYPGCSLAYFGHMLRKRDQEFRDRK